MDKKMMIGVGVLVLVVLAGAVYIFGIKKTPQNTNNNGKVFSDNNNTAPGVDMVTTSPTFDAKAGTVDAVVTAGNFKFDPTEIKVKQGDVVSVIFNNAEGTHDWRLDGYNVGTKIIQGGGQDIIQFTADKVGQFEYYCSIANHRQMGMKGTLIVEAK